LGKNEQGNGTFQADNAKLGHPRQLVNSDIKAPASFWKGFGYWYLGGLGEEELCWWKAWCTSGNRVILSCPIPGSPVEGCSARSTMVRCVGVDVVPFPQCPHGSQCPMAGFGCVGVAQ